jgi:hypothetical protein
LCSSEPGLQRIARATEVDYVSGEDLRLLVVHHVPCAGDRNDFEVADASAHIVSCVAHGLSSAAVLDRAANEQHRSFYAPPAGFRLLAAIEDGVDETVARVE